MSLLNFFGLAKNETEQNPFPKVDIRPLLDAPEMAERRKYCSSCKGYFSSDYSVCTIDGTILTPFARPLVTTGTANLDNRYKVTHRVGVGTLHEVYQVVDERTGRSCAVKILKFQLGYDGKTVRRYLSAVEQLYSLKHSNIATTFSHGSISRESRELPYLVMEWLGGTPLAEKNRKERHIEIITALNICISACDALGYAHDRGILHRDLKPSNIFVFSDGSIKITDFGLAERLLREIEWTQPKDVTATGSIYGDPSYLDPHYAIKGRAAVTTDIYSLGCILYECLTGSRLFTGENELQILFGHLLQEPPKVSDKRPELNKFGIDKLVRKCLEKDPAKRYQTAQELRKALVKMKSRIERTK
jgi:serine/threonine-protein kinase